MPENFPAFAANVKAQFDSMSEHELYIVDNDRDVIWETYLNAFPDGSNPIFRERTEHDCSCCRHFIRGIGNVVAIIDGERQTVWSNYYNLPEPYATVAEAMDLYVRQLPIKTVFRTKEHQFGTEKSLEALEDGGVRTWHHFVGRVAGKHHHREPETIKGRMTSAVGVFRRGMEEFTSDALKQVRDLIDENSIYRGSEFKKALSGFMELHRAYQKLGPSEREMFLWDKVGHPAATFKNTVLGTLIDDLSKGEDLVKAVGAFEAKVAPANYKRPKALITQAMIKDAMATITALDMEPALHRRFARIEDVSVNNVLFVNNETQSKMKDGVEALLMQEVKHKPVSMDHAQPISVDEFLSDVLPKADDIQLLVENNMLSNFVSLTAPEQEDTARLFKWSNDFAWSYEGNLADSDIKRKVKEAGGNVTNAALRVSLAWFNTDDLDIHCVEPSGRHVYYANRSGVLDVDMNVSNLRRDPVENLSWTPSNLKDGRYIIRVNQFTRRESVDTGFQLEVENEGRLYTYYYEKSVVGTINCLHIDVKGGVIQNIKMIDKDLSGEEASVEKWGVPTRQLVKVNVMMLSPNHWDDNETGNRHLFFILDGCKNPEPVRGIYNEFLSPALEKHRKVFEVLGDKTKCEPTDEQLSGLGFSSTRKDKVKVLARGPELNKAYEVNF